MEMEQEICGHKGSGCAGARERPHCTLRFAASKPTLFKVKKTMHTREGRDGNSIRVVWGEENLENWSTQSKGGKMTHPWTHCHSKTCKNSTATGNTGTERTGHCIFPFHYCILLHFTLHQIFRFASFKRIDAGRPLWNSHCSLGSTTVDN